MSTDRHGTDPSEEDAAFQVFLENGGYPLILTMRELDAAWDAFEAGGGDTV